jgi:hypothetical protein
MGVGHAEAFSQVNLGMSASFDDTVDPSKQGRPSGEAIEVPGGFGVQRPLGAGPAQSAAMLPHKELTAAINGLNMRVKMNPMLENNLEGQH